MPRKEIRFDKQDVLTCDERGRATLGKEFADSQVFVYIAELDVPEDPDSWMMPSEEEKDVLSKMAQWGIDNDIDFVDMDAEDGTLEDKRGEVHDTPYGLDT